MVPVKRYLLPRPQSCQVRVRVGVSTATAVATIKLAGSRGKATQHSGNTPTAAQGVQVQSFSIGHARCPATVGGVRVEDRSLVDGIQAFRPKPGGFEHNAEREAHLLVGLEHVSLAAHHLRRTVLVDERGFWSEATRFGGAPRVGDVAGARGPLAIHAQTV